MPSQVFVLAALLTLACAGGATPSQQKPIGNAACAARKDAELFSCCMSPEMERRDAACQAAQRCRTDQCLPELTGTWRCENDWGFNTTRVLPSGFVMIDWQARSGSEFGHSEACMDCTGLVAGYSALLSAPLAQGGNVTRDAFANSTRFERGNPRSMTAWSNMTIAVPCKKVE